MKSLLLFVFVVLVTGFTNTSIAQPPGGGHEQTDIKGRVKVEAPGPDGPSWHYMDGVKVKIKHYDPRGHRWIVDDESITNRDGVYRFRHVEPGDYRLSVYGRQGIRNFAIHVKPMPPHQLQTIPTVRYMPKKMPPHGGN